MAVTTKNKTSAKRTNPFPGLRPFSPEESHLFFGREGQVDNVVSSLMANRFIAVIGSSGSGKSSLIYCGVLGKIIEKGDWNIIVTKPGNSPFENFLDSVNKSLSKSAKASDNEVSKADSISSILAEEYKKTKASNLIIVDQFEELFRFRSISGNDGSEQLRGDYANFLVDLVKQKDIPVYIIITMRSDFIGECSRYQKFTSLINTSNYLIPRMSRENFHRVIEEPVKIFGASIDEMLVDKILDEVGDNQDQLPILQHAMMRTWNYWMENSSEGKSISISDYKAIGGIEQALSDHANESYDALNPGEKIACEKIFRTLTEKGLDNKGVRRPTKISNLSKIAENSVEQVINIVDNFREEGKSFLTPANEVQLDENSVIDLSHESLMRIWDRLNNWVDEEATAVGMYRRLSDSASSYQIGKTGLWRPPDLQLAINWRNKNKPNLSWGERHDPAFERTMVFLGTSQEDYEREENNKIRLQKLRLRRTRMFALVLGSVAIISLVMFLWTRQLSVNLEQQVIETENERNIAQQKTAEAEEQKLIAQANLEQANVERLRADTAAMVAEDRRVEAVSSAKRAATQTALAKRNLSRANEQSALAVKNEQEATRQQKEAELAREEAFTRRMLSIANSMAVKSEQITNDKDLKALLSQQAFNYNEQYGGEQFDVDIFDGLYSSLKFLKGNDYHIFSGHNNAVRSVSFVKGSSSFYSAGSDGKILKWNLNLEEKSYVTISEGRRIIEDIGITPNGEFLLAAENKKGLLLIDLKSENSIPESLPGSDLNIRAITIASDNITAYTAGLENIIEVWNLKSKTSRKFAETESRINSISISPEASILAAGTRDGKTIIWQVEGGVSNEIYNDSQNAVQSVKFSPDGKYLACGTIKGEIRIFNAANFEISAILTGHSARVTDLAFSPDGNSMVSTSYDNSVMLWDFLDFTNPPVVYNDNSGFVFSASFSGDGNYFVSGSADEARLVVRPVSTQLMSEELCQLITRNLTKEEWNSYVGEDIEYEKTCDN